MINYDLLLEFEWIMRGYGVVHNNTNSLYYREAIHFLLQKAEKKDLIDYDTAFWLLDRITKIKPTGRVSKTYHCITYTKAAFILMDFLIRDTVKIIISMIDRIYDRIAEIHEELRQTPGTLRYINSLNILQDLDAQITDKISKTPELKNNPDVQEALQNYPFAE